MTVGLAVHDAPGTDIEEVVTSVGHTIPLQSKMPDVA